MQLRSFAGQVADATVAGMLSTSPLAAIALTCFALQLHAAEPPLRVLFLGNSLTHVNDLPQVVEALSAAGQRRVVPGMIAGPN